MANVLFTIPDDFLSSVDRCAKKSMSSRSRFIRNALQMYIAKRKLTKSSVKIEEETKILEKMLS